MFYRPAASNDQKGLNRARMSPDATVSTNKFKSMKLDDGVVASTFDRGEQDTKVTGQRLRRRKTKCHIQRMLQSLKLVRAERSTYNVTKGSLIYHPSLETTVTPS